MLLKLLSPVLLAGAVVRAFPSPEQAQNLAVDGDLVLDTVHGEFEVFKRDAVLSARDLELADLHGVNLTEMYKHSHIKRDDGDHINIWVTRDFVPQDEGEEQDEQDEQDQVVTPRAVGVRLGDNAGLRPASDADSCGNHSRDDATSQNSPYSGGVEAIFKWADGYSGRFKVAGGGKWHDLVLAGSNSGANAKYRVNTVTLGGGSSIEVGTKDVRNDADWTRKRARKYGSSWRASSTGRETCNGHRIRFNVIKTGYTV